MRRSTVLSPPLALCIIRKYVASISKLIQMKGNDQFCRLKIQNEFLKKKKMSFSLNEQYFD